MPDLTLPPAMTRLFHLIYRSRLSAAWNPQQVSDISCRAAELNRTLGVTGLLVCDGQYFLQILEGEREVVETLYARIRQDPRHHQVVTLVAEPIRARYFAQWSMGLVALGPAMDMMPDREVSDDQRHYLNLAARQLYELDDHRFKIIFHAFTHGRWRVDVTSPLAPPVAARSLPEVRLPAADLGAMVDNGAFFAFQPIVDTYRRCISSYEALVRGPRGESPAELLGRLQGDALYAFDLHSKLWALQTAARLGLKDMLSLNFLPGALTYHPQAVATLLRYLAQTGFDPAQIVLEVTEEEIITRPKPFFDAISQLREAGLRLAIDDFGAGHAGLSLLADFQPDKLKIDRSIVTGIHTHGPRQAIVRAIVDVCYHLGIVVVAEGVEEPEELAWLQSAGVTLIQGYVFARPLLNGLPGVDFAVSQV